MEDAVFFSDDGAYTEQYLNAAGSSAEGSYASFVAGDEVSEANAVFDAAYTENTALHPTISARSMHSHMTACN